MRVLFVRTMIAVAAGMVAIVVLELVLRALPVSDGQFAAEPVAEWPIRTFIHDSRYTYSAGWNLENVHHGRINNFGYAAPFDYVPGTSGVIVIGDSFVASIMNDYAETLQGRLPMLLTKRQPVLAFGLAGADMPDYLAMAQTIRRKFSPTWVVVLLTSEDYPRVHHAITGFYEWAPEIPELIRQVPEPRRSEFARIGRTLALVRYVRGNLTFSPSNLIHLRPPPKPVSTSTCSRARLSADDDAILVRWLDGMGSALAIPLSRLILVFDSEREAIHAGKSVEEARRCLPKSAVALLRLQELAREKGANVIDSFGPFDKFYRTTRQRLDYLPLDGHWTPVAHQLMAAEAASVINRAE
jgi:hypothetical protein